ncbi:hypothetical protein TELCIR_07308 [Teladorsagia circumcincta]|uniref:Uncharacterized protein n=1 Tax=Teladorsagia circumcincta TaxID=45464 RepID=A0A2G9UKZ8_TELCI|nr:hypothetical protein TELCIR_07308 [Teladorsagia circumcincta]
MAIILVSKQDISQSWLFAGRSAKSSSSIFETSERIATRSRRRRAERSATASGRIMHFFLVFIVVLLFFTVIVDVKACTEMEFASPFVIDTSTPESLERDFYAWLNVCGLLDKEKHIGTELVRRLSAPERGRTRLGMSRQGEIREQLIKDGICTRETAPSRSSINQ